jgi:hypothetical protein
MVFIDMKEKNIIFKSACMLTPPTNGWSQLAYMPDRCFMAYTSAWLDLPAPGRETQISAQRDREKERAQYVLDIFRRILYTKLTYVTEILNYQLLISCTVKVADLLYGHIIQYTVIHYDIFYLFKLQIFCPLKTLNIMFFFIYQRK